MPRKLLTHDGKRINCKMSKTDPVISYVMQEEHQGHVTRKALFLSLEKLLKRPVISYFTSFVHPVSIDSGDVDIIEGMLLSMDLKNGLALFLSSPGGSGLAAERIINLCRQHSGTKEFYTIVPSRAKSAATMICMGASKIVMGPASELGPIDPQITITEGDKNKNFSVWTLVNSYKGLFTRATKSKGNLEPYLQQLANYDSREIAEFEREMELSEDIALRTLSAGMMQGLSKKVIRKKIEIFLTPKTTKSHGRPIYADEAESCGLTIESQDVTSELWKRCYELYIRTNTFVSNHSTKCIETKDHSFSVRK